MNAHDRAQQLISARMDAPLSVAEHRELNAHLAGCESCRQPDRQNAHYARSGGCDCGTGDSDAAVGYNLPID